MNVVRGARAVRLVRRLQQQQKQDAADGRKQLETRADMARHRVLSAPQK